MTRISPTDAVRDKSPTLMLVARQAGVSIATVSRVLNQSGPVAPETQQRVMEAARTTGYVPDPRFRMMRQRGTSNSHRTGNLGLLLRSVSQQTFVTNPYYARLFWSVEQEARAKRQHVICCGVEDNDAGSLPSFVKDLQVDGVLITSPRAATLLIERVEKLVPVVLLNTEVEGLPLTSIMPDEESTIRQALDHLKSLGHRRITFFAIQDATPPSPHVNARARAFERLALCGPDRLPEARMVVLDHRDRSLPETAADQLQQWRQQGTMPTAILCAGDVYALPFLEAAARLGVHVPGELSVTGVDDTVACEYAHPKLTSVRQPLELMGREAVHLLLQQIEAPQGESSNPTPPVRKTVRFDVELIKRDSCGPCAST